jgi:hypothetical protein
MVVRVFYRLHIYFVEMLICLFVKASLRGIKTAKIALSRDCIAASRPSFTQHLYLISKK